MAYYVYQLVNCSSGEPFYVGFTSRPNKRLHNHRCDYRSAAYRTIAELEAQGIKVRLEILNECQSGREAYDLEAFTIAIFPNLVNQALPSLSPMRGRYRKR